MPIPMPRLWNIPSQVVKEKMRQLFDKQWSEDVWDNFMDCLKENIE